MGIEATGRPRSKISLQARSIGCPNRVRRVVAHLGQDRRSDFAAGNRWLTHTGREVSPSGLKASMVTVRGSLVQGTRGLGRRLRLAGPKGRSVRRSWGVGNPVAWQTATCGRFRSDDKTFGSIGGPRGDGHRGSGGQGGSGAAGFGANGPSQGGFPRAKNVPWGTPRPAREPQTALGTENGSSPVVLDGHT